MSDPNNVDAYAAVLSDLRAKRDRIEAAIAAIEDLSGTADPQRTSTGPHTTPSSAGPGAYLGMTIPDAAIKLLNRERRAMANPEIWEKLKAGGLHLNSADPVNTVGSVLSRRFDKVGDLVRVGRGTWGLAEWYPGRTFKTKEDGAAGSAATVTPPPMTPEAAFGGSSASPATAASPAAALSAAAASPSSTVLSAAMAAAQTVKKPWEID